MKAARLGWRLGCGRANSRGSDGHRGSNHALQNPSYALGLEGHAAASGALGALLQYLRRTIGAGGLDGDARPDDAPPAAEASGADAWVSSGAHG